MFRGWGFLLGEIWVLIALAALLGLVVGWLVWGRRSAGSTDADEAGRLRAELSACQARDRTQATRIAALQAELATVPMPPAKPAAPAPVQAPTESDGAGTRPASLAAPVGGQADDLKRIRGIGPKLEALCNRLGFWHFDQIANWSEAEIAWVDANLEAFKGRVSRDDWVAQARDLAGPQRP